MRTIWKFGLRVDDLQTVVMPAGAQVLCVQAQNDAPQLWALVDPSEPTRNVQLRTIGTGQPLVGEGTPGRYVGTYQMHRGALVFHVFEVAA